MELGKRHIWTAIFCVYMAAVAYLLCFMKPDSLPQLCRDIFGIPIDKAAHFLMFLPFPIVAYGAFRPLSGKLTGHLLVLLAIFIAGSGIALGTEHIQGLLEYRSCDMDDFHADLTGLGCSSAMTLIYILTMKNRK